MSDLTFTDTEVPAVAYTRETGPNPFAERIQALADSMGDGDRSVSATTFTVPQSEEKRMVTLAQNAGREIGVTVRKKVERLDEDSANPQAKITIWTTKKISRPRGKKVSDATADAAKPSKK